MIVNHADHAIDNPHVRGAGRERAGLRLRSACALQAGSSSAPEAQRPILLDLVGRYDLETAAEYRDINASGLDGMRPELNGLLARAPQDCRPVNIVLVDSSSRISRRSHEAAEAARQPTMHGVRLYLADRGHLVGVENPLGSGG